MDRMTSMAVFATAAAEGSLSAAARRHGFSASMAGKHVAALEAEMGVRLMHRSTRSLALTEAGRTFLARCERILEEHAEARREAADTRDVVEGRLRIAAPVTYGALHLSDVVASFLQQHPRVTVEAMLSDRYADLVAEGIDVAVRIGRLRDSGLVVRRLAPCRMVLCASPALIAQVGDPASVADLARVPRLVFSDAVSAGDWTLADPSGAAHVVDGPVHMRSGSMEMLLAAALRGVGVVYGPDFVFAAAIADGTLVTLLPDHRTTDLAIHAVTLTRAQLPLRVRRFLDHLVASLGPQSGAVSE